ncbi:discoidin domain-containing protein, partial [Cellulomonas septica]
LVATATLLPATAAQAEPTLLSQGRPTTASSVESADYTPASAATDGVTTTRWASARSDDQWLRVDLGASAQVERVTLRWESAYATGYRVEVSTDGTTWRTLHSTTTGTGGTETLTVDGTGRYVRLVGTKRATGYGYSLWELQVYGTPGGTTPTPTPTGTCGTADVAQGRPATASSSEQGAGTAAGLAVDGDGGTRWSSAFADGQWWQVDLGSARSVCRVELAWEGAYARTFRVLGSTDGTTWTPLATVTDGTGGTQRLTVSGTARYVRLDLQTRATGYGFSLWDVRVQVTGGGTATPTPDPTPTGPADGKVRVAGTTGAWSLLVNGQPWLVKGITWGPPAGAFAQHADRLKALGVNTVRTWGTDGGSKVLLDAVAAAGMRTVAGFWLAPGGGPGSGGCPNYVTDQAYKDAALKDVVTWTTAYKDHPGVLLWDVGNESLLGLGNCYSGAELEAQRHAYAAFVNLAAQRIHQIDPNHPVTSTDAWTGAWPYYKASAPDLDLYGLNAYDAVCDAKATWVAGGYDKPYLITESGPAGEWEVDDDANGVPDQGTDADNAAGYTRAWDCVRAHAGVALGATMFHYGDEGDFGGIWFNVSPGGNRRLSYYALARAYGGSAAAPGTNTPPTFSGMTVANSGSVVAGSTFTVNATATDPDGDPITYHVLLNSKYVNGSGGLSGAQSTRSGSTFSVTAPQQLGVWKVYVFAEDGKGNVGVETRSFRVVPPAVAGTNIALGRPATASSFDPWNGNWTPGQATDGSYATRWASNWSDDEWIQVDLGSVRSFRSVQLVWESAYAKGYRVETSTDGTAWTTLTTVTTGDGDVDTLAVAGSARYVRVHGTARGTAYGYSLYELGVYA